MRFPFLMALCLATAAHAQDYEREARWRSEVVGNLVIGDAVDMRLQSGRTFLGLYTAGKAELPALLIVHGLGVHPNHGVVARRSFPKLPRASARRRNSCDRSTRARWCWCRTAWVRG